nr:MAG TPA: hypothetical protein [Caudoviricetes sp.]
MRDLNLRSSERTRYTKIRDHEDDECLRAQIGFHGLFACIYISKSGANMNKLACI